MPERIGLIAELDLTQFDRAVNSYLRSIDRMESATKGVVGGMIADYASLGGLIATTMAGITATVAGTALLIGKELADWTVEGIQSSTDFEQSIADIASVLRKTREEVQPLADAIDEMALDPLLVVSADQASDVVEQLARNGIEMVDILNGAAEATILLANATGGDFALSANVATMAMHMFNMQASELNEVADISQGVINNSRIELDDWALALGNGGAAAASYGIELKDFATIIAGTINNFHSARQAGTSFMNFVQRLVPITDTAAEAMKELGLFTGLTDPEYQKLAEELAKTEERIANLDPRLVHYDELLQAHTQHAEELRKQMVAGTNAFFDQEGNLLEMSKVVQILTDATRHLSEEERTEAFRRIFGNDALETALRLSKMTTAEFENLRNEIAITGSAEEAAATRTATLAKRWENLRDIWDTIQRKSGAAFNDMLLNLVKRLTELTNANQDRVIEFFGRLAVLADKLVTAMMPWVERTLPYLIDNIEALASWLVEWLTTGNRLNEWFGKMDTPFKKFIENIFKAVQLGRRFWTWLVDMAETVREIFRPFVNWVTANVTLKDTLIALAGAVVTFLAPLGLFIARIVAIGFVAAKAVSSIRRAWQQDFAHIRTIFETVWPQIRGPLQDFVNNFLLGRWGRAWDNVVQIVVTALREIERYLPGFFQPFANLVSDLLQGDWAGAWENVKKIALNTFEVIKEGLRMLDMPFTDFIVDVLEGDWATVWNKIANVAIFTFNALKSGLKSLNNPFTDFIVNILEGDWDAVWGDIVKASKFAFDTIVRFLYSLERPFTTFLANVLTGVWDEAWAYIVQQATLAYEKIVSLLYGLDMPFTDFLGNVLTGKWQRSWEQIQNFARNAYDFIIEQLYSIDVPFTDFLGNVFTGKWSAAWQQIQNFAIGAYNFIIEQLYSLDLPFTDFLANVLTGKWAIAWAQMQAAATGALEWVKQYLPGWGDDIATLLQQVINGQWFAAWETAKTIVNNARLAIIDWLTNYDNEFAGLAENLLSGNWALAWENAKSIVRMARDLIVDWLTNYDNPFSDLAQNLLMGNWYAAWENAKLIVRNARDLIVDWLTNYDNPFSELAQNLLTGSWSVAWENAKEIVRLARDAMVEWLTNFETPFSALGQALLTGNWRAAWEIAKAIVIDARDLIAEWMSDFETPFADLGVAILTGNWKAAWDAAKNIARAVKDDIVLWLIELNDPFTTFAANVLEGNWAAAWRLAQAGIVSVFDNIKAEFNNKHANVIIDFLKNIVLGDFKTAWNLAEQAFTAAVGLMELAWGAFHADILMAANDTRFPEWLRTIFLAVYAIQEATKAAFQAFVDFEGQGNAMFSSSDDWQTDITALANSFRQLANVLEAAFLGIQNFVIGMNMAAGRGDLVAQLGKMAENTARIREIMATLREEGMGFFEEGASLNLNMYTGWENDFHQTRFEETVALMEQLKSRLELEYLDLIQLSQMTGAGSVDAFVAGLTGASGSEAEAKVSAFAQAMSVAAAAVKGGYLDAGSKAALDYVRGIAQQQGIGEHAAIGLAQAIITAFGSNLITDQTGMTMPQRYTESFIDPLTGMSVPLTNESYNLGKLIPNNLGLGIAENQSEVAQAAIAAAEEAISNLGGLPPGSYDIGSESIGQLGQGATDNRAAGVDPYGSINDEIEALTRDLVNYQTQAGIDSVTGMGGNVTANENAAIDPFAALTNHVNKLGTDIVDSHTAAGNEAVVGMGTEAEQATPGTVTVMRNLMELMKERINDFVEFSGVSGKEAVAKFNAPFEFQAPTLLATTLDRLQTNTFLPWATRMGTWATNTGTLIVINISLAVEKEITTLEATANRLGIRFRDKINEYLLIIINNFVNLPTNIENMMASEGTLDKMAAIGQNIGNALKSGLDSQLEAVQASGVALADAAAGGVVDEAQIASPAKKFVELGDYIGQGLALGLEKGLFEAEQLTLQLIGRLSVQIAKSLGGTAQLIQNSVMAMQGMMGNFSQEDQIEMYKRAFGNDALAAALSQKSVYRDAISKAGTAAAKFNSNFSVSNNPVSFGPVYISSEVDAAQFEYRVKQIMQGTRLQ